MTPGTAARRIRLARPATAWLIAGLLLALAIAAVPLSRLAHQSVNASGGSLPVWSSAAYGAVGLLVAWRKPGNPLGWIFLLVGLSARSPRTPASTWWPTTGCGTAACRLAGPRCSPSPAGHPRSRSSELPS